MEATFDINIGALMKITLTADWAKTNMIYMALKQLEFIANTIQRHTNKNFKKKVKF